MATYKVWLKIKDSYGNEKEVDGGSINVDLNITDEDVDKIGNMALANYVKKEDLPVEQLNDLATDAEVEQAVVTAEHNTIKYVGFTQK
jgi:hypothetical protein